MEALPYRTYRSASRDSTTSSLSYSCSDSGLASSSDLGASFSRASTLPVDLLFPILAAVAAFPTAVSSPALEALSLTSHVFRTLAQPVLYSNPHLMPSSPSDPRPIFYRASLLLRTLQARPDLARAVRTLPLGLWTAWMKDEAKGDRRAISRLAVDFVAACTHTTRLSFPGVSFVDASDLTHALAAMHDVSEVTFGDAVVQDPWIVNLDPAIRDQFGTAAWSVEGMANVIKKWPKLRVMHLNAKLRSGEGDTTVLACELEEFRCCLKKNQHIDGRYLLRLLDASRASLRRLTLTEHQLVRADAELLLSELGANLHELEILSSDRHTLTGILTTIVQSCPRLHTLRLGSRVSLDSLFTWSLLAALPELRVLELKAVGSVPTDVGTVGDRLRMLPSLKRLSISHSEGEQRWSGEALRGLQERAKDAGLELVVKLLPVERTSMD